MNKRSASPKSRPVAAVLIIAATVFLLAGRACGVVGALLASATERLLGTAGTGLLCVTAWALAFILATRPGTASRLAVALWHAVKPRHTAAVVVIKQRGGGESAGVGATVPAPSPGVSPTDRRALQTVRDALKGLGYVTHEIEPLVAQMDPGAGFEKNVKSALKALRIN
jgi:hypothetical protein